MGKNMNKIFLDIKEKVYLIGTDFESVEEFISYLENKIQDIKNANYPNNAAVYCYWDDENETLDYYVEYSRQETDEEYKQRLNKLRIEENMKKYAEKDKEDKEMAEYLRLKEKYGK